MKFHKFDTEAKLLLTGFILMLAVFPFDAVVAHYVNTHNECRAFYVAVTDIGLSKWYLVPSGVLVLLGAALWKLKKYPAKLIPFWYPVVEFFLAIAAASLIATVIKYIAARARPIEFFSNHVSGFFHWHEVFDRATNSRFVSFPSGHATIMFAVATVIAYLLPKKIEWVRVPVFSAALVLSFSRVMVAAHYSSDAVAGAIVGSAGAILAHYYLLPWVKAKFAAKPLSLEP